MTRAATTLLAALRWMPRVKASRAVSRSWLLTANGYCSATPYGADLGDPARLGVSNPDLFYAIDNLLL
jgi:hypothetical protein